MTLFAYDTKTKAVKEVIENHGLDLKWVSAGPDALVYEQFGGIYILDPAPASPARCGSRSPATCRRPGRISRRLASMIQNAAISPTGARAVFEARGEILTVPAEKGDVRNLTRTTTVAERDPAWSPDGKSIAYFSDESGEYALHVADQSGLGAVKKIGLGEPPSFFYGPLWSPDSKKIAYTDKRLNLWYVDVDKGTPVKVATDRFDDPSSAMNADLVAGQPMADIHEGARRTTCTPCSSTRSGAARNRRSPTASATPVSPSSTRAGSTCSSPSARTWGFPPAGSTSRAISTPCRAASTRPS